MAKFDSGNVNKQNKQAGACNEILSQQFWWHQTALLPKSGKSLNKALGADMLSIEYPALILPKVRGIIEAKTTTTDRQRLQAYEICIERNFLKLNSKSY